MSSTLSSESEDEWMDNEQSEADEQSETMTFGSNERNKAFVDYAIAETMSKDLILVNFLDTGSHLILNRCEPVNKMYPSVQIPERLRKYDSLVLSMSLYRHDCETVDVRFPDLKDKIDYFRNHHGIWIDPSKIFILRMKKKAVNQETKKDTAFRLSTDFRFHTNNTEPSFIVTAIPFENGKFVYKDASVSKPFFVRSKRQERHTHRKKRKKGVEVKKINTDISFAQEQVDKLQTRLAQLKAKNGEFNALFDNMRAHIGNFHPTTNIALAHALRTVETSESVTL